ncbi:MAG: pseudouridine synthase [Candidatus Saccharimonadales bacterium]
MTTPEPVRLNKFLAQRLSIGRRAADELIEKGKVSVNGEKPELGARVWPGDEVAVKGKVLNSAEAPQFLYVLFHKPTGYVSSRRQQGDTPTIYSLLSEKYHHLKPVGRLDKDTSGIMLLTNDGDLAYQLTHPKFKKVKKYEVSLDAPLQPLHRQMIGEMGVQLDDGPSRLQLDRQREGDDTKWLVTMSEGRNRQIRRTFRALGYEVTRLHRIQFGNYHIQNMKPGSIKEISNP